MKKKLFLLSFMIVALIGVFAISVFAEDIIVSKTESAEYGTVIQLSADPSLDNVSQYVSTLNKINDAGTDTDALCIMTDGNADNPSYYVFPSSYIVNERDDGKFDIIASELADAISEFNSANDTSYYAGYEITGSGGGKRINSVVRFVFPSNVLSVSTSICCMREYPNLIEVRINHAIDFSVAEKMFYKNTKLASVVGFENVDGTKLYKGMFASCSALRYIKLPANIVKIPGSFFQGAVGVNVVNMAELTQLTTIDSWAFDGTQNLVITLPDSVTTLNTSSFESAFKLGGSITINPTSQLTTIGYKAFSGSVKLKSIYIPSTVTTISESAFKESGITTLENFENCKITVIQKGVFEAAQNLTTIKIPETVTTIEHAFLGNKSLTTVYIPTSVTTIADTFTASSWVVAPANLVILYIGKDASSLANCTQIANANVIAAKDYNPSNAYTGINLVLGYSHCIAYNNNVHSAPITDIVVTSFLESIKIVSKCVICDIGDAIDEIPALFTCLGYSALESGNGGIAIGYTVNSEAIAKYTTQTGKTLRYGVFAISKDRLGNNDIFGENGAPATGVLSTDITFHKFAMFELKITGFTDEYMDLKFAMGAYVSVSYGETTDFSYMQPGTPNEGEKYCFVSYNDIVSKH